MIRFQVPGRPITQGNHSRNRFGAVYDATKGLAAWRTAVGYIAKQTARGRMVDGPVVVDVVFYVPRPASCPKARTQPTVKPDVDKLSRALLDAITGVLLHDDAQVVQLIARKQYATRQPGALVTVRAWTESDASTALTGPGEVG